MFIDATVGGRGNMLIETVMKRLDNGTYIREQKQISKTRNSKLSGSYYKFVAEWKTGLKKHYEI